MYANEAFESISAPIRGAKRGLRVRAVFGQVTTFRVKDDGPAARLTGHEIPIQTRVPDAPARLRGSGVDVLRYSKTSDHATAHRLRPPLLPAIDALAEQFVSVLRGHPPGPARPER